MSLQKTQVLRWSLVAAICGLVLLVGRWAVLPTKRPSKTDALVAEGVGLFSDLSETLRRGGSGKQATLGSDSTDPIKLAAKAAGDALYVAGNIVDDSLPPLTPATSKEFGDLHREALINEHGVLTDRQSLELVNGVWQQVLKATHQNPERYTLTLIRCDEINAYAFVGGNVVVTKGFLEFANSCKFPAPVLRFALSHEMAHLRLGHTDSLFRRMIAADRIVPGSRVAPEVVATIIKQTPINQAAEQAADCFARRLHLEQNWPLSGGEEFFSRVGSGQPPVADNGLSCLFRSHPGDEDRLKAFRTGKGCVE